jgi:hypothetical protein
MDYSQRHLSKLRFKRKGTNWDYCSLIRTKNDKPGLQPSDVLWPPETQADGLGWDNNAPAALSSGCSEPSTEGAPPYQPRPSAWVSGPKDIRGLKARSIIWASVLGDAVKSLIFRHPHCRQGRLNLSASVSIAKGLCGRGIAVRLAPLAAREDPRRSGRETMPQQEPAPAGGDQEKG